MYMHPSLNGKNIQHPLDLMKQTLTPLKVVNIFVDTPQNGCVCHILDKFWNSFCQFLHEPHVNSKKKALAISKNSENGLYPPTYTEISPSSPPKISENGLYLPKNEGSLAGCF